MDRAVAENESFRDGVSQVERQLAALNPDYVSVDERTIRDLLAFSQQYAKTLNFFDADADTPAGDWRPFFADVDLDEALAYLASVEEFSQDRAHPYARPHFALLLTFLQLLGHARDQLNTLTKRHLDFFYQRVLGLAKRGPLPDHVHVLVDLARGQQQFALPAGIQLDAGRDSQGQPLIFRTDIEFTANQAQVAKIHTIFADKNVVGLVDVWEDQNIPIREAITRILEMTWGDSTPGEPLSDYPIPTTDASFAIVSAEEQATITNLEKLYGLVNFVPAILHLDFGGYRELLLCKHRYDRANDDDDGGWARINRILRRAWSAKQKETATDYEFTITNPRDFDANIKRALNLSNDEFNDLFDGFPEVVTLKDAYSRRDDDELRAKINEKLFLPVNGDEFSFAAMMEHLIPIESNWEETIRILTLARRTKIARDDQFQPVSPEMPLISLKESKDFAGIIAHALVFDKGVPYPAPFTDAPIVDLTSYDVHLQGLTAYFCMSAVDLHFVMGLVLTALTGSGGGNRRLTPEWGKAFGLLDEAHRQKTYNARRLKLKQMREDAGGGLDAMLYLALAIDDPGLGQDPLSLLDKFNLSQENLALLRSVERRESISDNDGQENAVSDAEWDETYQIAERIQRVVLPEPRPQIEHWRNLYPLATAKSARVRIGVEGASESTHWRTFGQVPADASPPSSTFGWAIGSPLLALSQGKRRLILTLGFDPDAFQNDELTELLATPHQLPCFDERNEVPATADKSPFLVEVSTDKGWTPIDLKTIRVGKSVEPASVGSYWSLRGKAKPDQDANLDGIQFELCLDEDFAPLVALPTEGNSIDSSWPVLRLMMRATNGDPGTRPEYRSPYMAMKALILRRVHLAVAVTDLQPTHLQNDNGLIRPDRPFEPFGIRPAVGSRFYFGHPDLLNKRLDSLSFQTDWMGAPRDLASYYMNYTPVPADSQATVGASIVADNHGFKAEVSLVEERKALPLESSPLFAQDDATQDDATQRAEMNIAGIPSAAARLLAFTDAAAVTDWKRYLQWELLAPDFQHGAYPGRAAALAVKMAADIANEATRSKVSAPDYQINPPYTPKIKKLSLAYTSSVEIAVSDYQAGHEVDRLYHIHPFGYSECQPDTKLDGQMFLPQFDYEGELYLGLRDLGAAQTLTLLFQLAEGSANPDLPTEPVEWHYLSGNRWLSLERGRLLDDGTRGFTNSGIVHFQLSPVLPNTLLDPELYWLRAAIRRHSHSVCDAIDVHTQVVSATRERPADQPNAPDQSSRPLAPEAITKLLSPLPQVAAIRQPYPSYGGRTSERDDLFYTRISERLRHKDRAVTPWDYERLILDQFPQIYKAKCLPTVPGQPGQVTVIVIPDIRHNDLYDPFAPKVAANIIADIETYLAQRRSVHASLVVKNPHYVPLKIRFAARFQPGVDEGFAKQRLNEDLNRFLSPWAYDESGEIVIGGRIYANSLINFIEEQPYVDYVAEVRLFKSEDGRSFAWVRPSAEHGSYWVEANRPDGVLVAARQHEIDTIADVGYQAESYSGINYMKIELDFIVG